jgi:hypothetical protein
LEQRGWLKAVAAADRGDPKMQAGMTGVATGVDQRLRALMFPTELNDRRIWGVPLGEMGAQSTLTILDNLHMYLQ